MVIRSPQYGVRGCSWTTCATSKPQPPPRVTHVLSKDPPKHPVNWAPTPPVSFSTSKHWHFPAGPCVPFFGSAGTIKVPPDKGGFPWILILILILYSPSIPRQPFSWNHHLQTTNLQCAATSRRRISEFEITEKRFPL